MPSGGSCRSTGTLCSPHRPAVVVLTSAADDEHLVRAVRAGATCYLLKTSPAEDVIAADRDAAAAVCTES